MNLFIYAKFRVLYAGSALVRFFDHDPKKNQERAHGNFTIIVHFHSGK